MCNGKILYIVQVGNNLNIDLSRRKKNYFRKGYKINALTVMIIEKQNKGGMPMNNHYYTENPDVIHDEKTWNFNLLNHDIKFTTDNGVFSKQTVDYGTRVMLEAFREDHAPAGKILDLGAGYGPVGIALALAYPKRQLDMVDVNNLALSLAQRNAETNSVLKQVNIFHSNVYEDVTDKYAAILTNPPVRAGKEVVQAMISEATSHLVDNGTLTVVLQKKQGAPSAKKLMEEVFGNCEIIRKDKGYYILESVKG